MLDQISFFLFFMSYLFIVYKIFREINQKLSHNSSSNLPTWHFNDVFDICLCFTLCQRPSKIPLEWLNRGNPTGMTRFAFLCNRNVRYHLDNRFNVTVITGMKKLVSESRTYHVYVYCNFQNATTDFSISFENSKCIYLYLLYLDIATL